MRFSGCRTVNSMMSQMAGKTVLVTGSTDGVGRYIALELARAGAHVLIHGRDQRRASEVVGSVRSQGHEATFYPADFSSLDEVRQFATTIRENHSRLDLLINNAGIGTGSRTDNRKTSIEGYELRFAVNYLSGFLLTHLLLPLLRRSTPARIVNVTSVGQQAIDFEDVMLAHDYSGVRAYCQSKLAQIMFTIDLADELKSTGVTVNCLHPATYMNTTMVRESGVAPFSTVEDGGKAILFLATSAALDGKSGLYFDGKKESKAIKQAYDTKARAELRILSCKLTGIPLVP
jgi:NAD(P)-dependent dehydrogenase (short-subunit alcohol dehydrogenase family)